ncbi:aldose 1-epimerase family protein [bacterium]|nr:aldose 1-epimerase family protein [bacterium]
MSGIKRRDVLAYAGNIAQVAGITEKCLLRGKARGLTAYEVRTGSGLEFNLLPDKCLDILDLRYKGWNIGFLAKNGVVGPAFGYPIENEFDVYWSAGMLCTCGLQNIGTDCKEADGRYHPLHGRIGMTPAEQCSAQARWEGDRYLIAAKAVMRESIMGKHDLCLERTVRTSLGSSEIEIVDAVVNEEASAAAYMLLYHFNFGYPFLGPGAKLAIPRSDSEIEPRNEDARRGLAEWDRLGEPIAEKPEEVFFHRPRPDEDGIVRVKLENGELGIGASIAYEASMLPVFAEWKSMRACEYALGLEPGTSTLRGRVLEEEKGGLFSLGPFERHERRLVLSFYEL